MSRITQKNEYYGNSSEKDSENLIEEADQDNMNQSTSSFLVGSNNGTPPVPAS